MFKSAHESSCNKDTFQRIYSIQVLFLLLINIKFIQLIILFCRFPNLRLLDFRKIKQNERKAAIEFFKSKKGKEIQKEITKKSKQFASSSQVEITAKVPGASAADIQKIREAIKRAGSLQEVERLTRLLQSGQITDELLNGTNNGGTFCFWFEFVLFND